MDIIDVKFGVFHSSTLHLLFKNLMKKKKINCSILTTKHFDL